MTLTSDRAELAAWHTKRSDRQAAPETIGRQVKKLVRDIAPPAMSPEDQKRARREFWVRQFRAHDKGLEDKHPARVWAAWRVTTVLARLKGFVQPGQTITTAPATNVKEDLWSNPGRPMASKRPTSPALATVFDELNKPDVELPVMPPAVPAEWMKFQEAGGTLVQYLVDGYDPSDYTHDTNYVLWFGLFERVCDYLDIGRGTQDCPELGMCALEGMSNPHYLRALWPTLDELMAMDKEVIDSAETLIARKGAKGAELELKKEWGLLGSEAQHVIKAAQGSLVDNYYDDQIARAVLDRQLDDIAVRAQEALSLPSELQARRMQMRLRGLETTSQENRDKEVLDALKEITAGRNEDGTPSDTDTPAIPQIGVEIE